MKKFNKILSWILVVVMVVSMCPALNLTAFAAEAEEPEVQAQPLSEDESASDAEESTEEPSEAPTEEPTEEPTEAPTEAPEEEETTGYGWYGDGTAAEYTISTAEELTQLAAIVNGTAEGIAQDSFSGKTVKLAGDIDLASAAWTPIGQVSVGDAEILTLGNAFAGTFDGNGKTISGLNASSETGCVALFGYSTGTIKNLTVSGSVTGNLYTAGVVAVGYGTISSVTSNVNVTVPADGQYVGGILGEALGTVTITDCHNKGVITNGGGSADKSTGRIGGIVGRVETGYTATITNCSNTGNITGYQYVGGIIGGAFGNVEIRGCYNTGTLTGISFGKIYLGGIAGKLGGGTIDSCYNWGTINATPWGSGHIRAVGGIAGCEEGHTEGTAITNCYNVGTINLDTSKMTSGKYIYMVGAISGGNNSDGNTMGYEDCFYLEGCIPSQDPSHESYQWWNASFKSNSKLYDTDSIVAKTADELKGEEVLTALGSSFKSNSGSYPVLTWQEGGSAPAAQSYAVSAAVSGGSATVNVAETAQEGSTVTFTVSDVEEGKQIKSVTVTDAAGTEVSVSESEGTYSFIMPARAVSIAVVLENSVDDTAERYALTIPEGLDAIWDVTVSSSQYDAETGTVAEGATVTIVVDKEADALSTSFTGITVTAESGAVETAAANVKAQNGVTYYAEYTFTMPASAVTVSVDITYTDLTIYVKEGDAEATLQKALTRAEMLTLAEANGTGYYSGWQTETTPFIGVAEQYVTLEQILTACGITLEEGDSVTVTAPDNFTQDYTYEQLTAERKYYSDILTNGGDAAEGTAFGYALVIKGNMAMTAEEVDTVACDTLNAYRFVYGQTSEELTGKVKCVDSMPKCIVSLTVNKAEQATVDTDWYNEEDTTFTITTAAQLAGLAQLVDEGNTFEGKTILLGNDIDLKGDADNVWNPIGSASCTTFDTGVTDEWGWDGPTILANTVKEGSAAFAGTFNGQGNEISSLYISSSEQGQGLFAFNTGIIQNLTVSGTIAKAGSDYIGGIAAFNRGTIADVTSNVTITVGGSYNVGGIVGYNDGYNEGKGADALITRCTNNGSVTAYQALAGIAGENAGTITYCVNNGAITSTTTNGKEGTGGIVGRGGNNGTALTVSTVISCYNTGTIKGNKWVGGIVGFNSATSYVANSYDVGKVSGYGSANPIIGLNEADTSVGGGVYDCYYLNTMKVYDASGVYGGHQVRCASKTEAELKDASFPALLGGAFVMDDSTEPLNDGYAVLYWERDLTMGNVRVDQSVDFGEITADTSVAAETNQVTVTVQAEKNYKLKDNSLKYTTDGETYTELTATETEGVYTFVMPKGDVTVTAEFEYTGTYWDGTTIDTAWYDASATVFVINTPEELAGFAAIVNGTAEGIEQDNFAGKTVQLGTNIALGKDGMYDTVENVTYYGVDNVPVTTTQYYLLEDAPVWTPIGSGSATSNTNTSGNVFAGTFDGKGYAVTGVYTGTKNSAEANTATVQGLFGIVDGGTIQNLTVSGCITGAMVVGGIVADLNNGTVKECTNKAIIFTDCGTTPGGYKASGNWSEGAVGGVIGVAGGTSTVYKCMNKGDVTCTGSAKDGRVGGIIGLIDASGDAVSISKCGNTGTIVAYQYVAGIVGMNASTNSPIDQCYNSGSIIGWGMQKVYAAGIVGMYSSVVKNCYNTGNIVFKDTDLYSAYSGGIAGAYGSSNPTLLNCYNIGTLNGTGSLRYLGMIIGGDGKASYSYYLDTAKANSGTSGAGGVNGTVKTEAEMKDPAFLAELNTGNLGEFISDDSTNPVNGGFPVLGWQLGAADPIPVSTSYEGEFKYEYIENQKFSIGTFKLYTLYNNNTSAELKEYEVYLDGELLDTSSYTFTMDDNGKTLKVTWTAQGNEVNYVEQTLAITPDTPVSCYGYSGSTPKMSYYFVGDTLDLSNPTEYRFKMASGTYKTVSLDEIVYTVTAADGTVLSTTDPVTIDYNGARLTVSYTLNGVTATKDWGTYTVLENKEAVDGYYQLKTATDMQWFAAKVNSGVTDINAIMLKNIDVTGISLPTVNDYTGTFDGNGKTLTVKAALFNSVTTGTIKNLTVAGTVKGGGVGGVVNTVKGAATIENCVNKAAISASSYRQSNIGGIVGTISADASGAKITRCINYGTVANGQLYGNNAGGIVGNADCADASITECVNAATVQVTGILASTAGGIAAVSKASVTDCYNMGTVKVTYYSGANAGGIVGSNSGTITNCYSAGPVSSSRTPKGAIAGANSGSVVNSCALTDSCATLVGNGTIDEISAFKTEEELKAPEMLNLLGASYVEDTDCPALFDGYPILAWQLVNGHRYEVTVIPGTCDELGYTLHKCPGCGISYKDELTPAQHSYDAGVVTAPTCTSVGYTTYTCSGCGHSYTADTVAAVGHSYESVVTDPTCTSVGYTTYTCSVCGDSYTADVVEAVEHSYESVVTEPTCTNVGYTVYTCSVCGHSHTADIVEAVEHSYESVVTEPTCTDAGYTTYTCTVCGNSYLDDIVAATGHSHSAEVTAPTCTELGYTTYTCDCGDQYVSDYVAADGHAWDNGTVTKEASEQAEGEITYQCQNCDASYTEAIAKLGHSFGEGVVTAPTCDTAGYTTYTCDCGYSYKADYVDALGHEMVIDEAVAPTCTETGLTVGVHCVVCDDVLIAQKTVDALGHSVMPDAGVDATCTESGLTDGSHCEVCGEVLVERTEISALGHSYHEGICTVCGAEDPTYVNPFADVIEGKYYYNAVLWAANSGIATGVDATHFDPDGECTRAMAVTLLWRAAGEPEPTIIENPFSDVVEGKWYYKAVLWAVEKGITEGYADSDLFGVEDVCTRAHIAAFLYRLAGEPSVSDVENPFSDVIEGKWYYDAVLWAAAEDIANGYADSTEFGTDDDCTRGQIVTFLYRYYN